MERSESIKDLATALSKAQAKIEGAEKDKTNPHYRSKYADLGNVVEAIKPANEFGLSYVQIIHDADSSAKVETIILHSSGEFLSCGVISVPVTKNDAQGFGSALTYARRYSLSAAFGIAPVDDDGNAAVQAKKPEIVPDTEGKKALESAKTLEDLQEAWSSLTPEQRHSCANIKDQVKARLTKAA